jgi:hypothetical protein
MSDHRETPPIERALASIDRAAAIVSEMQQLSERDAMQASAETKVVNPAKTGVRDIMLRIAQHDGYGLRESEIKKLAQHVQKLEALIARRPIGWYDEEHKYLVETGVL